MLFLVLSGVLPTPATLTLGKEMIFIYINSEKGNPIGMCEGSRGTKQGCANPVCGDQSRALQDK